MRSSVHFQVKASTPSITPRGLVSPIIQPSERLRRKPSRTRPETKARSFEPA
jgi:hypothetical protein